MENLRNLSLWQNTFHLRFIDFWDSVSHTGVIHVSHSALYKDLMSYYLLCFFFFYYKLSFLNFNIHLPFVIGQNIYTLMRLMSQSCLFLYTIRINVTGLPWWLSGKESSCQCRRHRCSPWPGKTPHATGQLSPWATTTELVLSSPGATTSDAHSPSSNEKSHRNEKPAHHNQRAAPAHPD